MFQQPQQAQVIPHIQSQQQQIYYNPVGGSDVQSSFGTDPHLVQPSSTFKMTPTTMTSVTTISSLPSTL